MRDSIDFGSMNISTLFRKLLIPTVLGMIFSAVFVITDGIFVGKGIGSDALAAVNITAPLFMITTGIGLMFGMGASVVASIHLSQGESKSSEYQYHPGNRIRFFTHSDSVRPVLSVFRTFGPLAGKFGTPIARRYGIYDLVYSFSGILSNPECRDVLHPFRRFPQLCHDV